MLSAIIRNPVKVTVGVLLVALFGTIGLLKMPTQLTPEVQIPTLTIETRWPGASPQEVERQIVQEQEEQLKAVEGVTKMTSQCMDSAGVITLEFAIGTNMQEALLKVNTRLQQVPQYPEDAKEPVISTANSGDKPVAWFILKPRTPTADQIAAFQKEHSELSAALEPARKAHNAGLRLRRLKDAAAEHPGIKPLLPPDVDVATFRKFAEDFIEARFERVNGVANSNVLGGREEELQVVVDPEKLAARQLTIADVRKALVGQNKDTSAGDIWEGKRRYVVRTLGQFRTPDQVLNAVLARRDGQTIYVRDVAEVQLGFKKPDGMVRQFGTSCIAINAQRSVGANVFEVMAGLRAANNELNNGILKDRSLYLEQVYDETEYIDSAISLVNESIVIGGILTTLVLLIFLRSARSTLVIGLAIPTSIIGTFLVLSMLGRSLNVVSLAGIAFAVGMLVDDAVVVLENIYQHAERGKSRWRASVDGAREVWGAVLSASLTKMAVFLPILFVQEEAGQLFRDIAIAISAGIGLSLIVAMTVIPVAAARLVQEVEAKNSTPTNVHEGNGHIAYGKPPAGGESKRRGLIARLLAILDRGGAAFTNWVININARLQKSAMQRFVVVAGFVGVSILLSWVLMPKVEYLPNGNQNLVFGILLPPPGYNLDQLTAMGTEIENKLRPYWDVDPDDPKAKELKYPPIRDFFFVARGRQVFLGLKARDELRAGELVGLVSEVSAGTPGTIGFGTQASLFEQGLSAGRTIDIEITGPELPRLIAIGGRIMGQVQQVVPNGQAIPQPSLDLSSPEIHITPKWEQAADVGVSAVELGYAINALVDGAYAGDYYREGIKIDLSIVGHGDFVKRTQALSQLSIATPSGDLVPLGSVAEVELRSGPEQVNRRQRQRAITIQVKPPPEMPLEVAMEQIQAKIVNPIREDGTLENGIYQISLAGTADKLRSTWKALSFNAFLALLITYLLMAALFESWLYPFVVILSVPLGAVGGFFGLWVLNLFVLAPLDVLTMLGFVILIGTVVNNPILIVEQALVHIRHENMHHRPAVLAAVRSRIRPIFMTTMTTVLGLFPLVLFPGAGSELYRGIGAVLIGGLLSSTIVTLVVVPAVFTLTLEVKEKLYRRFIGAPAEHAPPVIEEKPTAHGEAEPAKEPAAS